jgi:hypothetical protein
MLDVGSDLRRGKKVHRTTAERSAIVAESYEPGATVGGVARNNRRLLGPIGYITPAEAEESFYANLNTLDMVA